MSREDYYRELWTEKTINISGPCVLILARVSKQAVFAKCLQCVRSLFSVIRSVTVRVGIRLLN